MAKQKKNTRDAQPAFEVELRPHVGHKKTQRGKVPVHLNQDLVFLNGVEVGLIGRQENAPLCLNTRLDEFTQAKLKTEVERQRAATIGRVSQPPAEPAEAEWVDDPTDASAE